MPDCSNVNNDEVTILVNSCDLYEDAWYPFFKLLEINWPDCPYNAIINTETKIFNYPFCNVRTINTGTGLSWTARLKYVLSKIDSKYILFFLEDFFLLTKVRVESFRLALSILNENDDVGMVHFVPNEKVMPVPDFDLENCFYELPIKKRTFRTRVAVTLFRKEYFLRLLYGDENPWQYERESHLRSMVAGYKIIRQNYQKYPSTFTYILDHSVGIGITAKQWLENTKIFMESQGIYDINYDNLGVITKNKYLEKQENQKKLKSVGFRQMIYSRIVHPIKIKVRHWWFLQDVLNYKKLKFYRKYYEELDKQKDII